MIHGNGVTHDAWRSRVLAWLVRHGAAVTSLSMASSPPTSRTVLAAAPIAAGADVLRIPRPLLLTVADARASSIGRTIASSGMPSPGDHTLLAACLLAHRERPRSRFRPYLDSLPVAFPTLPLSFTPAELALLQGSAALEKLAARRAALKSDHRSLCHAVPAFRRFALADFVWARSCVITRVFGLTIAGEKTEALVPLADMLDHRRPAETHWTYDDDAGAFVMTALRAFHPGQPVHDSYGRKSNTRFLVNYGFTLDDNDDDDEAAVRLAIPADAPLPGDKARLLGALPGEREAVALPAPSGDGVEPEALSFLRVACATPREIEQIHASQGGAHRVLPLNGRNESAALALLAAACEEARAAFPTSVEQDDALLGEGAPSTNARNAVVARRSEKRVLMRWIDLVRSSLPLLRLPRPHLARALGEGAAGDGDARRYLEAFVASAAPRRGTELTAR